MARHYIKSTEVQKGWRAIQDHLIRGDEVVVVHYTRPVALITAYQEDTMTTTTTDYGTWHNLMGGTTLTVEHYVAEALDEQAAYDVDMIATEYRAEINDVLPEGVSLNGDNLYGPHPRPDWWLNEDSDEWTDLKSEIEAINLWGIVAKHEQA